MLMRALDVQPADSGARSSGETRAIAIGWLRGTTTDLFASSSNDNLAADEAAALRARGC